MAEFVMKDLVRKAGKEHLFIIDSAAVSREEIGNGIHYGTRNILHRYHIPYTEHYARQITPKDGEEFDLILCMDASNIRYAKRILPDKYHGKIKTLMNRNIADPWYTGNFEETYRDVLEGCQHLLNELES